MEKWLVMLCLVLASSLTLAEDVNAKNNDLYDQILKMDTQFFTAFNQRDMETVKALFARDLEFYHDKGGFTDYQQNLENTAKMFANNKTLQRELITETMQVYPLGDYGALQLGEHRFCDVQQGKRGCSVYKFTHVWRKTGNLWQIARVISYDH
ncbi:nuclear transport factor 2 family protein [Cellvibrio fontiphilus]|uniref:Nuclear transport factor 2 family protein n=1 Tax=Cellvibrio fontiphilus TaxID=1815559 RepID=A0ABV7FFA6_9GAMM